MFTDVTHTELEQNSEEWYNARLGRITSSHYGEIMAFAPNDFGKGAHKYARKLARERITGKRDEASTWSGKFADRGHEFEPVAINLYEEATFNTVRPGGFYESNMFGKFGDSPDGRIGDRIRAEVKTVIWEVQYERFKEGGIDPAYSWQVDGHLAFDADAVHYIQFCPEAPKNMRLYLHEVKKNQQRQDQLFTRLLSFEALVQRYVDEILNFKTPSL